LGVERKYFCPNLLKLTAKFDSQEWLKLFLEATQKGRHVYFGKEKVEFGDISTVNLNSSYNKNKGVETSVPKFCWI